MNPIKPPAETDSQKVNNDPFTYRKYSYQEIEERIQKNYFEDNQKYSSALDIVATAAAVTFCNTSGLKPC